MTKKIKRLAAREEGFTLVELLVVILIIGILIAIALPTFLNQQNKAHDSAAQQKLNTAYKVAKSEETSNSGVFPSAASLATAINASEPELGTTVADTVADDAAWVAAVTNSVVHVRNGTSGLFDYGTNGSNDLELGTKSTSGSVYYLKLQNNGAPTTSTTP